MNVEEKINQGAVSGGVTSTGTVNSLTSLAQGTNYTDRIGNSIKLQRIEVRMKVIMNSSSTGTLLRVILFRDLYQSGTAPGVTDVLNQNGSSNAPLQPYNWLLRDRIAIIYDEIVALSGTGDNTAALNIDVPHSGHVKYVGTTSGAASNGPGSVYLLLVSDEATNTPTVTYAYRVTFTDD